MEKLIFVYNADSGLLNLLKDAFHKWFSPKTYPCSLCALTWGNFSEEEKWRDFYQSLAIPCQFLHKDEFYEEWEYQGQFPVVFSVTNQQLSVLISPEQLNGYADLDSLMVHIKPQIETPQQPS
ncbi:hypothetical protein [Algicola sagamiensis]|uniref:hypothetical protein n=1 Tax=Algicola sagamiensis TaxID=163869 RepID=UPI00036EBF89|nr:hypothetical protein [Algicola sagamiensis]